MIHKFLQGNYFNYVVRKFVIPQANARQKFLFASLSVKIKMVQEIKGIGGKPFSG